MKKFLITILVMLLAAGCVGGLFSMSDGFKNWEVNTWFKKQDKPPISDTSEKLADVKSVNFKVIQGGGTLVSGHNDVNIDIKRSNAIEIKIYDILGNELEITKYDVKIYMSINKNEDNAETSAECASMELKKAPFGAQIIDGANVNLNNFYFYNATLLEKVTLFSPNTIIDINGSQKVTSPLDYFDFLDMTSEELKGFVENMIPQIEKVNFKVVVNDKIIENYSVKNLTK